MGTSQCPHVKHGFLVLGAGNLSQIVREDRGVWVDSFCANQLKVTEAPPYRDTTSTLRLQPYDSYQRDSVHDRTYGAFILTMFTIAAEDNAFPVSPSLA